MLIADTRRLFAEALGDALNDHHGFEVIGIFPSHGRGLLNVVDAEKPDIVLLDFWLGEMQGTTVARLIKRRAPDCRVVLLSWLLSPFDKKAAYRSGVSAIVSKDADIAEVEEVVRELADLLETGGGDQDLSAFEAGQEPETAGTQELERLMTLTPREMDVLTLLTYRPKDISETLKISEKTVRNHVNNILRKAGARSAVEAVAIARRHGLI